MLAKIGVERDAKPDCDSVTCKTQTIWEIGFYLELYIRDWDMMVKIVPWAALQVTGLL
jgi:hypothetical protein